MFLAKLKYENQVPNGKDSVKLGLSTYRRENVRCSPFVVEGKLFRPVLYFGREESPFQLSNGSWALAVNERNEIAITEYWNHKVSVFSSDGTHLRSFGKKGNKRGEFKWPAGIAFHNENILVADHNQSGVQIVSGEVTFLNEFGNFGCLDHQLKYPRGLSVDTEGNCIVADSRSRLIKIFSPGGQFLRKFGGEKSFVDPYHCIQPGQYFIVSDCGDHCIKYFDLEGNFLFKVGKEGFEDGEFNEPCYLSVNSQRGSPDGL